LVIRDNEAPRAYLSAALEALPANRTEWGIHLFLW